MAPTIDGKPILTQKNIVDILTELDIKRGDTVLVHSSLKSLGYVIGGAEAVINAIIAVSYTHLTLPTILLV